MSNLNRDIKIVQEDGKWRRPTDDEEELGQEMLEAWKAIACGYPKDIAFNAFIVAIFKVMTRTRDPAQEIKRICEMLTRYFSKMGVH